MIANIVLGATGGITPDPVFIVGMTSGSKGSGGGALVLGRPAGTQDSDMLILFVSKAGAGVLTPPVGWTVTTTSPYVVYAYKATAGSDLTYSFSTASVAWSGVLIAVRRPCLAVTEGMASGVGSVITAQSVTTNNGILFAFYCSAFASRTFSTPNNMTPVFSSTTQNSIAVFMQKVYASQAEDKISTVTGGAGAGQQVMVKNYIV